MPFVYGTADKLSRFGPVRSCGLGLASYRLCAALLHQMRFYQQKTFLGMQHVGVQPGSCPAEHKLPQYRLIL